MAREGRMPRPEINQGPQRKTNADWNVKLAPKDNFIS